MSEGGTNPLSGASPRGIALIAVAVLIGFVLIGTGLDTDSGGGSSSPAALPAGAETTTTTAEDTTSTTVAEALPVEQVRVLVCNASSTDGAGGRITDELNALNYATLDPSNCDPNIDETIVYFAEGFEQEAAGVASAIGAPETSVQALPVPSPVEVPDGQSAPNVVVLVGADIAGG
jgi:hypothetical protein